MHKQLSRIYAFLGSYQLAIGLLATLAAVLSAATVYEARTSTQQAGQVFYHAGWFAALLVLTGVNVTVAALRRWPWQPRHTGFLITHLAIDLLLVGALITLLVGVDGTMTLTEGSHSNQVTLNAQQLQVDNLPAVAARAGAKVTLVDGTVARIEKLLASAQPKTRVEATGGPENPAVHFTLSNGSANADNWLVARDPQRSQVALGPLSIRLSEASALPAEAATRAPQLHLQIGDRQEVVPVLNVGEVRPFRGTPYRVRILAILQHASVDGKHLVENPQAPPNPAVQFILSGKGKSETHTAFSRFPDFPTYTGHTRPPSGLKARLVDGTASGGPAVAIYWLPKQHLFVRVGGKTTPVKAGQTVTLPWMGLQLTIDQIAARARLAVSYQPAADGNPAALVALGGKTAWLGLDEDAALQGHKVRYASQTLPLPFTITLKKFIMKQDPGTHHPASFASDVVVSQDGRTLAQRIQMNEPLEHGGYTFFQSGYLPGNGGPATSILQVARDPGVPCKYAGTFFLVLGVFWVFWLEPILAKRRAPAVAPARESARRRLPARASTAILLLAMLAFGAHGAWAQNAPAAAPKDAIHPHAAAGQLPAGHPAMPADASQGAMPAGHPDAGTGSADATVPPPANLSLDAARHLAIQADGRAQPLDTYARNLVLTVTGGESFDGRDPVDLLLSWTVYPSAWSRRDVIYVANKQLKETLGLDSEPTHFSYATLAPNQKLRSLAQAASDKGQKASSLEKEAGTVMDRLVMLDGVFQGRALTIVPAATRDGAWTSIADGGALDKPTKTLVENFFQAYQEGTAAAFASAARALESAMRAKGGDAYPTASNLDLELFYNQARPFRTAWVLYVVALILVGLGGLLPLLRYLAFAAGFGAFIVQTAGLVMRCMIAHRPPVTNMYESVVWVAWGAAAFGILLAWRHRATAIAVAAAVMASILLILTDAIPGALDPSIQPLMPVLRSNFWLTVHVLTITLSYAAFALALALGHAWLVMDVRRARPEKLKDLGRFLNATLRIGVLLLAAGTLLGGVWANYSWGRFWGWDPKEVWALIALLGYLIIVHGQFAGWIAPRGVAVGAIIGFLGVLMAWYGVNFVLGVGLHSYGFSTGGVQYAVAFVVVELLFVAAAVNWPRLTGARSS